MNYYDQQLMYYPPHLFEDGYYLQPPPQVTAAFNDYYYNSGHPSPDSRSVHYRKQRERRKLKRSVSARTISPKQAYSYYQDYDEYAYQPAVPKRKSKKRNSVRNEPIDPDTFLSMDGEPMNENELLALANSRINEVICKAINNKYNIPASTPSAPTPPPIIPTEKENEQDLSNLMESLTVQDSVTPVTQSSSNSNSGSSSAISSGNTSPKNGDTTVKEPDTKQKKKKWPFGFLFKKTTPEPEKSSSTPTTPSLSPHTSMLSISPFQPQLQERVWAYKLPMAPMTTNTNIWIRFDPENQKRINDLVLQQQDDLVQLFDSRFGQGNIPMVVIPSLKTCYFPLFQGQFACMEVDFFFTS